MTYPCLKHLSGMAAAALFAFTFFLGLTIPADSHIIGGSINTDFWAAGDSPYLSDPGWQARPSRAGISVDEARGVDVGLESGRTGSHYSRNRRRHQSRHHVTNNVGLGQSENRYIEFVSFPSGDSLRLRAKRGSSKPANKPVASFKLRSKRAAVEAISSETRSRSSASFPEHEQRDSLSRIVGATTALKSADAFSDNPFLRVRRDTAETSGTSTSSCPLPENLPAQVRDLNSFLEESQYIGVVPEQDGYIPLPPNQPHNSCPAATGSWWPRREINLRSTCPWVWEELDNGPDAYPRHIRQAKCMCQTCIRSDSNTCQEFRRDVTIFRLKSCQNGLAVMEKDIVTVTLGCFCAAPEPVATSDGESSTDHNVPLTD